MPKTQAEKCTVKKINWKNVWRWIFHAIIDYYPSRLEWHYSGILHLAQLVVEKDGDVLINIPIEK